jgi:hypothetical protein
MPLQRHTLKPKNVLWASAEVIVSYSCASEPTVASTKVRGLKGFAIGFGHEYDIEAAVEDSTRLPCAKDGCHNAIRYQYIVKSFVAETVGIGLNIGNWGTGTAGWTFPATEEVFHFEAPCICCDEKGEPRTVQRTEPAPNALAMIAAFALLATANTLSVLYIDHPSNLGRIFLNAELGGLIVSAVVTISRVLARRRRAVRAETANRDRW